MPALPRRTLARTVVDAIGDSGGAAFLTSGVSTHPLKFSVIRGEEPSSLWVYIWTLTHGGRTTLPNEYRIQMTGVRSPLAINPAGQTLLLGYEPNLEIFAGFDLGRHRRFTPGSPSVQIDITALHSALQNGLSFDRKTNGEIAMGIRTDMLMGYSEASELLHRAGTTAAAATLLNQASATGMTPPPRVLNRLSQQRQRVVQQVSRLSRSANFRQQVLQAYGHRCAITRIRLKLVEAAHILPVAAGRASIDDVTNGIALSPTYHSAFDRGLIFLDDAYSFNLNSDFATRLRSLGLDAGLAAFTRTLGRIHLPADRRQWPDRSLIRQGNRFRGI